MVHHSWAERLCRRVRGRGHTSKILSPRSFGSTLQAERALGVPCTYLACVFPWGGSGELTGDHGEGLKYRWLRGTGAQ